MGAMEDQQRKNIESQLAAGRISKEQADIARAGLDRAVNSGGTYVGGGNVRQNPTKGSTEGSYIESGGSQRYDDLSLVPSSKGFNVSNYPLIPTSYPLAGASGGLSTGGLSLGSSLSQPTQSNMSALVPPAPLSGFAATYKQGVNYGLDANGATEFANRMQALVPSAQSQQSLTSLLPPMPKYDVYKTRDFDADRDWKAPDIGNGDITWLPTNKAIEQFDKREENKYDASRDAYDASYDQWKDQYDISWKQQQEVQRQKELQDQIARELAAQIIKNQQWQKNYDLSLGQTTGLLPGGQQTLDARQWEWEKPWKEKEYTASISATNRSGRGSGGGGETEKPSDWEGAIYSTADYYASGKDYLADLERHKQPIIAKVGVAGYRRLVNDAYNMGTGSKYKPGGFTGSPLGSALRNAGVL